MQQKYDQYNEQDHLVWRCLFERQINNLRGKAVKELDPCFRQGEAALNSVKIPDFRHLNEVLQKSTGWSVEVVPGLIPVEDFFQLLSQRQFPSSTWLRRMDQLDYLEEPDMFHDIFGHIPLLFNRAYADFMERFGRLGLSGLHDPWLVSALERLYWFTIEFGLCFEDGKLRIMGAGILSSYGETNQVFEPESYELRPFDLGEVLNHAFYKHEMQPIYYVLPDFKSLFSVLERIAAKAALVP